MLGQSLDPFLVAAQGETLVEAGIHLPLKLWDRPAALGGLNLIETAFTFIFDPHEDDVV